MNNPSRLQPGSWARRLQITRLIYWGGSRQRPITADGQTDRGERLHFYGDRPRSGRAGRVAGRQRRKITDLFQNSNKIEVRDMMGTGDRPVAAVYVQRRPGQK